MLTDREIHAAAASLEILRNLTTRCAGSDNQYSTGRKLIWISVLTRMHLKYGGRNADAQRRSKRVLVRTGRNNNIGSVD
jgi:hypothetical protein